ncbi:MAG: GvpL/GvpF family gas vesicle protein [Nitrospirota bacterium]
MSVELRYLYCVTEKIPEGKVISGTGEDVHFIFNKGIYAAVSKVEEHEFSEENLKINLNNMEWLESRVRKHEKVIEEVMEQSAVIPFKFATIFKADESLQAMLDSNRDAFKNILKQIEGKEEWGVKIYCDMEKFKNAAIKENEQIQHMEKEIASSTSGRAYLLAKKKEKLADDIVNIKIVSYAQGFIEVLKEHSIEVRINRLLPKEVTERKDEMLLNTALLIEKSNLRNFINNMNYLKEKYNRKGLDFNCTGPWPPYNFCNLSEKGKTQNE